MNVFCEACAKKPGWEFKTEYIVNRSCARCMQHRPCNFYKDSKPIHESVVEKPRDIHSPHPKQLVKEQVNPQSECNLPRATGVGFTAPPPPPQVNVDVHITEKAAEKVEVKTEEVVAAAVSQSAPQAPVDKSADSALAALELTRAPNERGKGITTKIEKR